MGTAKTLKELVAEVEAHLDSQVDDEYTARIAHEFKAQIQGAVDGLEVLANIISRSKLESKTVSVAVSGGIWTFVPR